MTEDWLKMVADETLPVAAALPNQTMCRLLADIALSQRAIAAAEQERVAILKTAMAQLDDLETRVLTLEANEGRMKNETV